MGVHVSTPRFHEPFGRSFRQGKADTETPLPPIDFEIAVNARLH
jgi:hypothetical protein